MHKRNYFLLSLLGLILLLACGVSVLQKDLMLQLLAGLEDLSSCGSCLALLFPLKALAQMGDDALTEALIDVCTGLDLQEEDVCVGALQSQAPIIAHSLRSISLSKRTATLFCSKIFGLCPYPAVPHYTFPLPKATRNITTPTAGRKKPLKFVHITDIHIDRSYKTGSEADCDGPICCRKPAHGKKVKRPAGAFGNYLCDSPVRLFDSMLDAINDYAGDASAIIFTGDTIDHAVWLSTRQEVDNSVTQAYGMLQKKLKMPVYGAIGNHDVSPTNSFPRADSSAAHQSDWALQLHADLWASHIGPHQAHKAASLDQSGSFSVKHLDHNLRIISLNTNYWYKANFWLYDSDRYSPDAQGLLRWLADELQKAEDAGEQAWIIGHMSPGVSDNMEDQSAIYDQIVQRYHKTLTLQLYGHVHFPTFEIGYSTYASRDSSTARSISLLGPALTPNSGNPAFRILEVDPDSFELMDYTDIIANLSAPGYHVQPEWRPYISARETYGGMLFDQPVAPHEPLGPAFWHRVTEAFESSDGAFHSFMSHRSRGAFRPRCFSAFCKQKWLYQLRAARAEYNGDAMLKVGPDNPWSRRKRAITTTHHHHEEEEEDLPGTGSCSGMVESGAGILKALGRRGIITRMSAKALQKHSSRQFMRLPTFQYVTRFFRK